MTLKDFLLALKTKEVRITLVDAEGDEMIKFFSEGYINVESEILARTVKRFDLTSATSLSIVLNNTVDETTPETNEATQDTNNAQPYSGD